MARSIIAFYSIALFIVGLLMVQTTLFAQSRPNRTKLQTKPLKPAATTLPATSKGTATNRAKGVFCMKDVSHVKTATQPIAEGVYSITIRADENFLSENKIKAIEQVANSNQIKSFGYFSSNAYQHWVFTQNGNGTYTISNFQSGYCLTYNTTTAKLIVAECTALPTQQWYISGSSNSFTIQNAQTKQVFALKQSDFEHSIESADYSLDAQKTRSNTIRQKLVMVDNGEVARNKFDLVAQKCDVKFERNLLNGADIAVNKPKKSLFLNENSSLAKWNKGLYTKVLSDINVKKPLDEAPPNMMNNLASDAERERLSQIIDGIRTQLEANTGNIHYFLSTNGLLGDNQGGIVFINQISRPALAELTAQLNNISAYTHINTLSREQCEQVVVISKNIRQILNDSNKVLLSVAYYATIGSRDVRFSAVDSWGSSVSGITFYIMSPAEFNEYAQFACNYYICEAKNVTNNAHLNNSDLNLISGYYHVFAVQSRNGINKIVGYEGLAPSVTTLIVKTDL